MGKNKNLLKAKQPDSSKRLSVPQPVPDPDRLPPKFCLRGMRNGYSIADCEKEERAAFASRLYELSRMSWQDSRQASRHGQGWETLPKHQITGDAIPTEITADVDLIAFRFHGKAPMVGYRSKDGVFNIVWLDRAFTLYNHS
jgi:hypothetical protein